MWHVIAPGGCETNEDPEVYYEHLIKGSLSEAGSHSSRSLERYTAT